MVNGRLVEQKKRTKTEEAKGNYVQIQMIAAMAAVRARDEDDIISSR